MRATTSVAFLVVLLTWTLLSFLPLKWFSSDAHELIESEVDGVDPLWLRLEEEELEIEEQRALDAGVELGHLRDERKRLDPIASNILGPGPRPSPGPIYKHIPPSQCDLV